MPQLSITHCKVRLRPGVLGSLFGVRLLRPGTVKETDFLTCEELVPLRRQDEGGCWGVFLARLRPLLGVPMGLPVSLVNVSFSSLAPSFWSLFLGLVFFTGEPGSESYEGDRFGR